MGDNFWRNVRNGIVMDGVVRNIANSDLGNGVTSYTYFNMARDAMNIFTAFFTLQNTTLTLEASDDPAETDDASATWTDVTNLITNADSWTASDGWVLYTPVVFGRMRIKSVTTNATNACKIFLVRGRA